MRVKSASLTAIMTATACLSLAGCATRPSSAPPASMDTAAVMVQSATAMLGQPYRFGGAAPGGFDCSGLVIFAARSAGIHLPRTVKDQLRAGVPIARRELAPGDLVFMHLDRKELHVGIDSLAAPPYSTGFMSARRVIGFERRTADPWVDLAILA